MNSEESLLASVVDDKQNISHTFINSYLAGLEEQPSLGGVPPIESSSAAEGGNGNINENGSGPNPIDKEKGDNAATVDGSNEPASESLEPAPEKAAQRWWEKLFFAEYASRKQAEDRELEEVRVDKNEGRGGEG